MDLAVNIYSYGFTGFIAVATVTKLAMKLFDKYEDTPNPVQIEELITIPIIGLGCLGLFAYTYKFALFNQLFWQIYVALMLSHIILATKIALA